MRLFRNGTTSGAELTSNDQEPRWKCRDSVKDSPEASSRRNRHTSGNTPNSSTRVALRRLK